MKWSGSIPTVYTWGIFLNPLQLFLLPYLVCKMSKLSTTIELKIYKIKHYWSRIIKGCLLLYCLCTTLTGSEAPAAVGDAGEAAQCVSLQLDKVRPPAHPPASAEALPRELDRADAQGETARLAAPHRVKIRHLNSNQTPRQRRPNQTEAEDLKLYQKRKKHLWFQGCCNVELFLGMYADQY